MLSREDTLQVKMHKQIGSHKWKNICNSNSSQKIWNGYILILDNIDFMPIIVTVQKTYF